MTSTTTTNAVTRHVEAVIPTGTANTVLTNLGTFSGNLIPSVMAVSCDVAGGLATLDLKVIRTGAEGITSGDVLTSVAQFAVSAGVSDFQIPASVLTQIKEFIAEDDRVQYGTEVDLVLEADATTTAEVTVSAVLGFIDRV